MLDGKKTFIGLGLIVLGYLGVAQFVGGEEEITKAVDALIVLVGIAQAIIGRVKAKKIYSK